MLDLSDSNLHNPVQFLTNQGGGFAPWFASWHTGRDGAMRFGTDPATTDLAADSPYGFNLDDRHPLLAALRASISPRRRRSAQEDTPLGAIY